MIILNGILWHKLQLLPIFRVHILVWNDLWSYWTIVSCYEMGVEKWKWYDMSILLILNVCVTKWVHFAIWLILDQSEQNSLTLLIFVMKWVTHIGQYEWFYLYGWRGESMISAATLMQELSSWSIDVLLLFFIDFRILLTLLIGTASKSKWQFLSLMILSGPNRRLDSCGIQILFG